MLGLLFLERHAGIVVACAWRHRLFEDFKCLSYLARTVAGRTGYIELRRIEFVESVDKFRAGDAGDSDKRIERNLATVGP